MSFIPASPTFSTRHTSESINVHLMGSSSSDNPAAVRKGNPLDHAELDAVRGTVPIVEYHPGKIVYRLGTPEAWPEEPVTYSLEDDDFERFQNQLGEPLPMQAGQKLADLLEEKPPWGSDIEVNGS